MIGMLFLLAAAATPAHAVCQPAAGQARGMLRTADGAMARGDYGGANASLDAALKTLGSAYASPPMNDDTGMHLVLAESQQRRGKPRLAAEQKRRILLERLDLCGRAADAPKARR